MAGGAAQRRDILELIAFCCRQGIVAAIEHVREAGEVAHQMNDIGGDRAIGVVAGEEGDPPDRPHDRVRGLAVRPGRLDLATAGPEHEGLSRGGLDIV